MSIDYSASREGPSPVSLHIIMAILCMMAFSLLATITAPRAAYADDSASAVESNIMGWWCTCGGIPYQTYRFVHGGMMDVYTSGPNAPYHFAGQVRITSIEAITHAGEAGSKINTDSGTYYYLFPSDPNLMQCRWGANGYSGTDSLQRGSLDASVASAAFNDVGRGDWLASDGWLMHVMNQGLMSGYAGTTRFGPDDPITRGQVATILFRYANPGSKATTDASSYASNTTKFRDNASGQYYTAAMNWALEQGVFTGDSATGYTTVRPGDGITRQELATVLYRFATGRGASAAGASAATYAAAPDARSVQGWASEGMGWCYKNSVMTGDSSTGRLNPAGGATRAHMAKMITVVTRDVL